VNRQPITSADDLKRAFQTPRTGSAMRVYVRGGAKPDFGILRQVSDTGRYESPLSTRYASPRCSGCGAISIGSGSGAGSGSPGTNSGAWAGHSGAGAHRNDRHLDDVETRARQDL